MKLIKGKWLSYYSDLEYNIINNLTIDSVLDLFKKEVIDKLNNDSSILLQFKICSSDKLVYRSISTIEKYTKSEFSEVYDIFKAFWEIQMDEYIELISEPKIIISYNIVPDENDNNKPDKISRKNNLIHERSKAMKKKSYNYNINGYNLPNTMEFIHWGDVKLNISKTKVIVIKNSKVSYEVEIKDKELNVNYIVNGKIIFSFNDLRVEENNMQTFTRIIKIKNKDSVYKYINGEIVLKIKTKNLKKINKIKLEEDYKYEYITMDLETRTINGEMSVFCCSIFDGKDLYSFYLNDFNNDEELLIAAIKTLFKRKYKGLNVYLHNFSNFDSIFLLKILSNISLRIVPIINDNDLINLTVKFSDKYNIKFKDSYLLLPSSLRKLAINFNVEEKGIYPYKFVNEINIPLDYVGKVPSFEYFEGISAEEYDLYTHNYNDDWNLKEETIKYCNKDVIVLYNIIKEFNLKIYSETRINAIKYPTLSSLAFAIYRSNFMEDKYEIKKIYGEIYDFIKKGYYGGAVDVYIHKPDINQVVYRYDVNSLYPYVMKNYDMPTGNPQYFEGDIYLIKNKPFGFFEVEVESPKHLEHPILLFKSKNTNFKNRTIAPLGKWRGVYFSEEIENAKKYGYKFKVLRGYTFNKKKIFMEYVDKFYDLKCNANKNDPIYIIAKLLLNSLYGKFGMSPYKDKHDIIDNKNLYKFVEKYIVNSTLDLKNEKQLISYTDKKECDEDFSNTPNVNIAIAAAITAYARIFMSKFKNSNNFTLFYSDTDCIDIDKPLNKELIGTEIGDMKLEHVFTNIIYVAPKVYAGLSNNLEVTKIKGSKIKIPFKELEMLLYKNNKVFINQEKWYKDISNRKINIKDEIYSLMVTSNKRKILYDKDNHIIKSEPFIINEID
jgi:hypothetical protein